MKRCRRVADRRKVRCIALVRDGSLPPVLEHTAKNHGACHQKDENESQYHTHIGRATLKRDGGPAIVALYMRQQRMEDKAMRCWIVCRLETVSPTAVDK